MAKRGTEAKKAVNVLDFLNELHGMYHRWKTLPYITIMAFVHKLLYIVLPKVSLSTSIRGNDQLFRFCFAHRYQPRIVLDELLQRERDM